MLLFVLYSVKNIPAYFNMHQRHTVPVIDLISFSFYLHCPDNFDPYEQQNQHRKNFEKKINKISPYYQHY